MTGPNQTNRGKPGTKYHRLTGRNDTPLHVMASAANVHDSQLFELLLETSLAVRGRRRRPGRLRRYPHRRGLKVRIARRGIQAKTHLGWHRWVVERTVSWLLRFKRLSLRYGRTEAALVPLLLLAVPLINIR